MEIFSSWDICVISGHLFGATTESTELHLHYFMPIWALHMEVFITLLLTELLLLVIWIMWQGFVMYSLFFLILLAEVGAVWCELVCLLCRGKICVFLCVLTVQYWICSKNPFQGSFFLSSALQDSGFFCSACGMQTPCEHRASQNHWGWKTPLITIESNC